jgi:hypothetical protein
MLENKQETSLCFLLHIDLQSSIQLIAGQARAEVDVKEINSSIHVRGNRKKHNRDLQQSRVRQWNHFSLVHANLADLVA